MTATLVEPFLKLIDLSHTIVSDMAQWPGDKQPLKLHRHSLHGPDSHLSSSLEFGCHVGTHIDAPLHFLAGQPGILFSFCLFDSWSTGTVSVDLWFSLCHRGGRFHHLIESDSTCRNFRTFSGCRSVPGFQRMVRCPAYLYCEHRSNFAKIEGPSSMMISFFHNSLVTLIKVECLLCNNKGFWIKMVS